MTWKTIEPQGDGELTPIWDFEANKELTGTFKLKKEHVGSNDSNIYVIEVKKNEEYGVWGTALLNDRFNQTNVGDKVRIIFNGLKDGKGGRQYKDYTVQIDS